MSLPDLLRTTPFRLALGANLILAASMALVFALITWQAERFENARVDRLIASEASTLAREAPDTIRWHVDRHFDPALRSTPITALFDRAGRATEGDVARLPDGLAPDGRAHRVLVAFPGGRTLAIRAVAVRVAGGGTLLIGRDMRELNSLRDIVLRALALSFVPALGLSLAGAVLIGTRALSRIRTMNDAIDRIMAGGLDERLPEARSGDDLDRLARSTNRMLERLERLVHEVRGVGDDIAHDLRTPLARVRATLDRARAHGGDRVALEAAIDRALADLDRVFALITALLRISAIETEQRRVAFGQASLRAIAADARELYEPIADAKGIALTLDGGGDGGDEGVVVGDADLLMEAVANLVDNAIKFTEAGGHVTIGVGRRGEGALLTVDDDGIGVAPDARGLIAKRFYRADRSRHVQGNGLGLSLVAAIASLHAAELLIEANGRGSRFGLLFRGDA